MNMRRVEVTFHNEDGLWWAEAELDADFYAAGDTLAQTWALVREAAQLAYHGQGVELSDVLPAPWTEVDEGVFVRQPLFADHSSLQTSASGRTAPGSDVVSGQLVAA